MANPHGTRTITSEHCGRARARAEPARGRGDRNFGLCCGRRRRRRLKETAAIKTQGSYNFGGPASHGPAARRPRRRARAPEGAPANGRLRLRAGGAERAARRRRRRRQECPSPCRRARPSAASSTPAAWSSRGHARHERLGGRRQELREDSLPRAEHLLLRRGHGGGHGEDDGLIASQLELLRLGTGTQSRVVAATTLLKRTLFRYQGHVSAALVLGGVDCTGPRCTRSTPTGRRPGSPT